MQLLGRALGIGRAVDAPQALELLWIEALRPERHAGDAGGAIVGEAAALDGSGIGLERDFDLGRQLELPAYAGQQPRESLG